MDDAQQGHPPQAPSQPAAGLLAVAPMMACTDTHCRTLHRLFSPNALLFTEMVTAGAVVYGPRQRLLRFQPEEAPVACQLGGSDPSLLAEAAQIAASAGFAEINLNVGCPSPRVRQGAFGAALMAEPRLVSDCLSAMTAAVEAFGLPRNGTPLRAVRGREREPPVRLVRCALDSRWNARLEQGPEPRASRPRLGRWQPPSTPESRTCSMEVPVTVKCRLGLDGRDSDAFLDEFIAAVCEAGCRTVYVHARIAVLDGLNPAQNRSIPPLQPERVHALKERFPELRIIANGGIETLAGAAGHLAHVDGVMVGRAAWREPRFLSRLDRMMFGTPIISERDALDAYLGHVRTQLAEGERLADLVRPILGLFKGRPGARRYRQRLSCAKALRSNRLAVVLDAIDQVEFEQRVVA